jgi:hypothetical protein
MRIYLKVLSLCYLFGAVLHLMDLLSLRLDFSTLTPVWQFWIVYLLIFDFLAGIGLWRLKFWGVVIFLIVASSQLVMYLGFKDIFGDQLPLILFHLGTLAVFFGLWMRRGGKLKFIKSLNQ